MNIEVKEKVKFIAPILSNGRVKYKTKIGIVDSITDEMGELYASVDVPGDNNMWYIRLNELIPINDIRENISLSKLELGYLKMLVEKDRRKNEDLTDSFGDKLLKKLAS